MVRHYYTTARVHSRILKLIPANSVLPTPSYTNTLVDVPVAMNETGKLDSICSARCRQQCNVGVNICVGAVSKGELSDITYI